MPAVAEPGVVMIEDIFENDGTNVGNPWQTVLYNCSCHTYDQVIEVLIVAICCTREEAYEFAWTVDHHGQASVYHGEQSECQRVMLVLRGAGLRAEVEES